MEVPERRIEARRVLLRNFVFWIARGGVSARLNSPQLQRAEIFECTAEEFLHVSLNFFTRRYPAGGGEVAILFHQHVADDAARVLPFVDELVEHARVRMLRREA